MRRKIGIISFGLLLTVFGWSTSAFHHALAASHVQHTHPGITVKLAYTPLRKRSYEEGFRDGYTDGNSDGRDSCNNGNNNNGGDDQGGGGNGHRHHHRGSHYNPDSSISANSRNANGSDYDDGYSDGYDKGFARGLAQCDSGNGGNDNNGGNGGNDNNGG